MRTLITAASLLFFLTACATSSVSRTATADAPAKKNIKPGVAPQIDIAQTSGVAIAARYVEGGISVRFAVRVTNPAKEPITLRRATIQSVGDGAYYVGPYSMPFNVRVAAAQHQDVQFWAPARTGPSVVGANGPVMIRVICEFDWANGRFQEVVTRVVNARASVTGQ